jgi:hypothetical protein
MAGLITFTDKSDPDASFVMNTSMPSGKVANFLASVKVVNAIRHGEFKVSDEDARKAGGLGKAIKNMIGADNSRYFRLFDKLRAVQKTAVLTPPDVTGFNLPEFTICESENDVTLTSQDYGRGSVVYDVGELFDRDSPAEPSADAWKGVIQVILNAWGVAEAVAIHPDHLNSWTSCNKTTLKRLRAWTFIRATGRYAPVGNQPGVAASDRDKEWASKPFQSF